MSKSGRKPRRLSRGRPSRVDRYDRILSDMVELLESARRAAARTVNAVMTAAYWEIGRRIVEVEQAGKGRAGYGEQLLESLSADLTARFGRGFSVRYLRNFRAFYLAWPIRQTLFAESKDPGTVRASDSQSAPEAIVRGFPLPWSHYVHLLSVADPEARRFYEAEALRCGWSVRQLDRQIVTLFYERTLLSRNKAAMLRKGEIPRPEDIVSADEEIKDPFVLEFLNLKDEYSESDLEEALITRLEQFLLELGGDFAFVARQRRLRIGDQWYKVDLLFFHRRLRCLVVIDLKVTRLTHADAGQMHMYLNYARENWLLPGENPPVGLILCARKEDAVARYALEGLASNVLAAEYRLALPDEALLADQLAKTRRLLESRRAP